MRRATIRSRRPRSSWWSTRFKPPISTTARKANGGRRERIPRSKPIGCMTTDSCTRPCRRSSNPERNDFAKYLRMTPGKTIALAAMLVAVCAAARGAEPAKTGYHVTNKYTIGGDAGWDYIAVDPEDRRVYVTHHRSVEVLDADTGKVVGRIKNMNGARGVALVKSIGKGFATNGKTDSVIVVDLKTLERVGEIKAGKKPDATIYDHGTDRVFVNNGDSNDMTVIDPKAGKVVGTIPLGGGPEFLAADVKGTAWTNLFDKGAFVTIDTKSLKVTKTTPIEGCRGASR